jgi:hypothetical protein
VTGTFQRHEALGGWMASCGGEGCGDGYPITVVMTGFSQDEAIPLFTSKGWQIEDGRIRCPDCAGRGRSSSDTD